MNQQHSQQRGDTEQCHKLSSLIQSCILTVRRCTVYTAHNPSRARKKKKKLQISWLIS